MAAQWPPSHGLKLLAVLFKLILASAALLTVKKVVKCWNNKDTNNIKNWVKTGDIISLC